MKILIAGVSAFALMTGSAYATGSGSGGGVTGPTIMSAWESEAGNLTKEAPRTPDAADRLDPKHPFNIHPTDPSVRMEKTGGSGQTAYIDQIGNDNSTNADQDDAGSGAVVDVVILGNTNVVGAEQETGYGSTTGDYATVTIQGDRNNANVRQKNTGHDANKADIHIGGLSDADAALADYSRPFAEDNVASIRQRGEGNLSEIDITQPGVALGPEFNNAMIYERGDDNRAKIDIVGDNNDSSIWQIGDWNAASISQDGNGNASRIDQDGDNNAAKTIQDGDNNGEFTYQLGYGNDALTKQIGDLNMSVTNQFGDYNSAATIQRGDNNMSDLLQDGDWNVATVVQDGNMNVSALEQLGDHNSAMVQQNGHDFSNIQQHGNSNVAMVSQGH